MRLCCPGQKCIHFLAVGVVGQGRLNDFGDQGNEPDLHAQLLHMTHHMFDTSAVPADHRAVFSVATAELQLFSHKHLGLTAACMQVLERWEPQVYLRCSDDLEATMRSAAQDASPEARQAARRWEANARQRGRWCKGACLCLP